VDKKEKKPFYANVAKTKVNKTVPVEKQKRKSETAGKKSKKNYSPEKEKSLNQDRKKTFRLSGERFKYKVASDIFEPLSKEACLVINAFDEIVQSVSPLNSRQLAVLPYKIRDLSHELTDSRGKRRLGYMNSREFLSAYVRYFSWWNLYRLCSVFESLPENAFNFLCDGDTLLDIGSGPLTAVIALWISRPELRRKNLNVIASDLSHGALALGEELFMAVAARTCAEEDKPWRITKVKGAFGIEIRQKASFVICTNMFNELVQDSQKTPDEDAKNIQKKMLSYADKKAAFFIAEPGVPRSSRFISLFRDGFIRKGFQVLPCTHGEACAFPGIRNTKWCHFVRDTSDAPEALAKRSESAGLSKDRAAISFVFALASACIDKPENAESIKELAVRINSDEIMLPDNMKGRYGCSRWGAVLITGKHLTGIKAGSLVIIKIDDSKRMLLPKDKKTGFLTIEIDS